jgi:uncharacterized protein
MVITQAIQRPFGVTAFGSAVIRVAPDIASVTFAVSRVAQTPREVFREAAQGAQAVREYLNAKPAGEMGASGVQLSQQYSYSAGENRFVGYRAKVSFNLLMRDLDRLEEVLVALVDAGANEIEEVDMQTTRLHEVRAEVRTRAMNAAREKAEHYCRSAGIKLGPVVHIEDVNPDVLLGVGHGHAMRESLADDTGALQPINPGSIIVRAAVLIGCEIGR